MLRYRYQPLQYNDSIRILVLHPSLNIPDPITFTIQHARLSDASLEYEALSYTWGDITYKQTIHLYNGRRELLVGKNCSDALRRLRLGHRDRLLWIDAICINQENPMERACQVCIMDDVFSRAFSVVVFLGEQVTDSRALFEELAAVDELLRLEGHCHRPSPSVAIIQELEALFERPWFKRIWVLQEVCAKDSVTIMYGAASTSFEALNRLYFGYKNTIVTKKPWPLALDWVFRPPEEYSTPQFTLWNRLYQSRDCLATDPKDKVFALKSLTGFGRSEMDSLVNYAQSVEECFTHVATFLLPVLGLKILTAIRHPHEMNMPSWIPDWSQNLPLEYYYFVISLGTKRDHFELPPSAPDGKKSTTRSLSYRVNSKRSELLATGCQYARITARSQEFRFNSMDEAEKQMKGLYNSLNNLRQFLHAEGMRDNLTMFDGLGQSISDSKTKFCMPYV
jgi:hypothetical protein